MQGPQIPAVVSIRPFPNSNRFLSTSSKKAKHHGDDLDVKVVHQESEDTYFLLENVHGAVYKIKPASHPNHFVFCSSESNKKYGTDLDIRTHHHNEQRNNWIIENVGWSTFTIRSETNPNFYLFAADEGQHQNESDVRAHTNLEQRNLWFIITIPNIVHPYPLLHQPPIVTLRPILLPQHFLTFGDAHSEFEADFAVKARGLRTEKCTFYLDRLQGNTFTIRPTASPIYYLFCANGKTLNKWNDFDARFHLNKEARNNWIIEPSGPGYWIIRSATNPDQFLFGVQDEGNGQEFNVRTHPCNEERNKWAIDGFNG
ncbi:unnamed protein product (macronuclear) [Paramecium tetraurelia]|uniref:Chromosome undetermined scaffold_32, whole genome shotgun sequence n=1 Tax=Paramecium tetraurelia TaxID=5888 RepID=Q3SD84_PARTE|nr:uncharacterized protein GSPATT00011812001 [Paramecium tetraurelia]CAI44481.1 KdB1 [Paramecium tetraurelia]CAK76239.1 unnamed protein product [Paramecium tetraurelia]|eukprot:XP_001443636.1 hypothetical protein (macronuclear) [Paramecium tetraurelia strain d4-2]